MKSCRSMLFVAASIVITGNNHIAQSDNQNSSPQHEDQMFLTKLQEKLKNIPKLDLSTIVATGKQEFTQKNPTNHCQKAAIIHKVILNRVKANIHTIASKLIDDQDKINNIVQSISSNVKTQLEENNCLNNKVLEKFFGSSLKCMVRKNIGDFQTKCKICERNFDVECADCSPQATYIFNICPRCLPSMDYPTPPFCPIHCGENFCPFHDFYSGC